MTGASPGGANPRHLPYHPLSGSLALRRFTGRRGAALRLPLPSHTAKHGGRAASGVYPALPRTPLGTDSSFTQHPGTTRGRTASEAPNASTPPARPEGNGGGRRPEAGGTTRGGGRRGGSPECPTPPSAARHPWRGWGRGRRSPLRPQRRRRWRPLRRRLGTARPAPPGARVGWAVRCCLGGRGFESRLGALWAP